MPTRTARETETTTTTADRIRKRTRKLVELASTGAGHGKHRLYAEAWEKDRNRRIAFGWNNPKDSDLVALYRPSESLRVGTCAEAETVIRALGSHKTLNESVMVVVRAKKNRRGGDWVAGESRPCETCMNIMRDYGVKVVGYVSSDQDGQKIPELTFEVIDR